MKLNDKRIGVALSGSFCTYDKVFKELQKLVDEGAKVQTIFSDASQTRRLTVVLERRRSSCKRQKNLPESDRCAQSQRQNQSDQRSF